jgi:uncharacterized protein (TIGR02996 family)
MRMAIDQAWCYPSTANICYYSTERANSRRIGWKDCRDPIAASCDGPAIEQAIGLMNGGIESCKFCVHPEVLGVCALWGNLTIGRLHAAPRSLIGYLFIGIFQGSSGNGKLLSTWFENTLNERSALLDLILANPADDTSRLVLADLLRESDDASEIARGRFLWAGVTAARFSNDDLIDDPLYYTAQQEIAAVSSAGYPAGWLADLGIGSKSIEKKDWGWKCDHDRVTVRLGKIYGIFSRGMLSGLSIGLVEWVQLAQSILTETPLQTATIIEVPGLSFEIDQHQSKWRLTARLKLPTQRIPLMGSGALPAAMAPSPFLIESEGDWYVEELFPTRAALVEGISNVSTSLVDELCEAAGNRWPRRPRGRRGRK